MVWLAIKAVSGSRPGRNTDMSPKAQVQTDRAPAPAAAYSQGVRKGSVMQISGQVAIDPETDELVHSDDVGAQTIQALNNVNAVLEASGARFDDIVMLRVYLRRPQVLRPDERRVRGFRPHSLTRRCAACAHDGDHRPAG
jgi:enamine deaminase RidA (YjgF/YER057c/UK114 family)